VTLEQLGNLGDLVAAIATVTTLAYLALQIRASASATRAASHHAMTDSLNQLNFLLASDAEMNRIWMAGSGDRAALSDADRSRFDSLMLALFHMFDTMHYQAHVGAGERALLLAEERSFAHLASLPGVRAWWAENPYAFGPEFRAYIEGFIAKAAG
jgi:hypothetical protein